MSQITKSQYKHVSYGHKAYVFLETTFKLQL